MKRFFIAALLTLTMFFFAACGGDSKKNKDNSDTAADADTTDTADDSDEAENNSSNCTGLSFDWTAFTQYRSNMFYVTNNAEMDPILIISFYQDEETNEIKAGTYDLGSEENSSFETCTECVYVQSDYVEAASEEEEDYYAKNYFQKSGTLTVDAVDDSSNIKGTIKAVFAEAEIAEDLKTTFIEGGECLEIETASFDSGYEEPCVPQCDGKECGSDGCGGTCGTCDGKACSADFKCVPFSCDKLELDEFEIAKVQSWFSSYKRYEAYVKDDKAGSTDIPDLIAMTFYTQVEEDGELYWDYKTELAVGEEKLKNYDTDETTIVMYEDYDDEDGSAQKYYIHESGTLNFTKVKKGTLESQGTASFRVIEAESGNSAMIPVAGGKCYEFKDITWDTICVPKCEGKVCGDDGCGGTCGDGCGKDKACSADQKSCVAWNCTEITLGEGTYDDWYGSYDMSYTPNTQDDDIVSLALYSYENETYDLYDTDINDSDLFFIVYEGYDEEEGYSKLYFQQKGTVKITTEENEEAIKVKAEISGLRLEEVKSNTRYNKLIPVPGGACYEVKDTTITYTIEEEEYDYDYGD